MKKILNAILVFSCIFCLVGCGSDEKDNSNNTTNNEQYNTKICVTESDMLAKLITVTLQYDNNNEVKNIKMVSEVDNYEVTNQFVLAFEKAFKNINGVKSEFSDNSWIQEYNFTILTIDDYKNGTNNYMKETFNLSEEDINYDYIKDNKILLDDYITEQLSSYTCN